MMCSALVAMQEYRRDFEGNFGPNVSYMGQKPYVRVWRAFRSSDGNEWQQINDKKLAFILSSRGMVADEDVVGFAYRLDLDVTPARHISDVDHSDNVECVVGSDLHNESSFLIRGEYSYRIFTDRPTCRMTVRTCIITHGMESVILHPTFQLWSNDDEIGITSLSDRIKLSPPDVSIKLPAGEDGARRVKLVHSQVIFASSAYFATLASWPHRDTSTGEVLRCFEVDDFDETTWSLAVDFMYDSRFLCEDPVVLQALCVLGQKYLIRDLFLCCVRKFFRYFNNQHVRSAMPYLLSTLDLVSYYMPLSDEAMQTELNTVRKQVLSIIRRNHVELVMCRDFAVGFLDYIKNFGETLIEHDGQRDFVMRGFNFREVTNENASKKRLRE